MSFYFFVLIIAGVSNVFYIFVCFTTLSLQYDILLYYYVEGEMKRLSHEHRRIEELQNVMDTTRPQSRSTPRSVSEHRTNTLQATQSNTALSADNEPTAVTDPTFRLSELDESSSNSADKSVFLTRPIDSITRSYHGQSDRFSEPNIQSMSQSTEEPFILHSASSPAASRNTSIKNGKKTEGNDSVTINSPKQTPKRTSGLVRSSSNGFLSSSQLSRKKVGL